MPRPNRTVEPWLRFANYVTSNVRHLRAAAGWTQQQLAERAAIDWKYLQEIESGTSNVTLRTLVALATALDVEPQRLLDTAPIPERRRRGRPRRDPTVAVVPNHVAEPRPPYGKRPR